MSLVSREDFDRLKNLTTPTKPTQDINKVCVLCEIKLLCCEEVTMNVFYLEGFRCQLREGGAGGGAHGACDP